MTHLEKFVRVLSQVLAVVSAAAIVAMVIAVAADVVARNATGASLPGMIEIAESSLVISVFFGLAWAGVKGEHVAVTLLADRFGPRLSQITSVFVWIIASGYLAWLLLATTLRAIDSTAMQEERFGLVRWPLYPLRWVIVAGLAAMLLVALVNLARSLTGKAALGPNSELEAVLAQGKEAAVAVSGAAASAGPAAPAEPAEEPADSTAADATRGEQKP
ncbi:TRAP transporter small permease [Nesterenkonia sp.]|uniref:TRAP transporter small permease n=1 Tax=Nesterenkonia sp. TaxID=704201 RepID=UPI00262E94DE|nr:TRAP transporter small permease [Nesterenkonia sp.]